MRTSIASSKGQLQVSTTVHNEESGVVPTVRGPAIHVFFKELDRRFLQTKNIYNFNSWLQMFAFDVMGVITLSKSLGFVERGEDAAGIHLGIDLATLSVHGFSQHANFEATPSS